MKITHQPDIPGIKHVACGRVMLSIIDMDIPAAAHIRIVGSTIIELRQGS